MEGVYNTVKNQLSKLESEERRLVIVKKQFGAMSNLLKTEKINLKRQRAKFEQEVEKAAAEKFQNSELEANLQTAEEEVLRLSSELEQERRANQEEKERVAYLTKENEEANRAFQSDLVSIKREHDNSLSSLNRELE